MYGSKVQKYNRLKTPSNLTSNGVLFLDGLYIPMNGQKCVRMAENGQKWRVSRVVFACIVRWLQTLHKYVICKFLLCTLKKVC